MIETPETGFFISHQGITLIIQVEDEVKLPGQPLTSTSVQYN